MTVSDEARRFGVPETDQERSDRLDRERREQLQRVMQTVPRTWRQAD